MESENGIIDPVTAKDKVGPLSGHFRIFFTGYRTKPVEESAASQRAPAARASAWNTPEGEDDKAYFQADISWINLAAGGAPQNAVLTAMITGDVRGLKKRFPWDPAGPAKASEWLPLSLGTYALVSKANAISIGNPTIERPGRRLTGGFAGDLAGGPSGSPNSGLADSATKEAADPEATERKRVVGLGRPCVVDLPLSKTSRSKVIFLTYETANTLAMMDQGLGRGVFPIECGDPHSDFAYTLYFGIDRL